MWPEQSTRLCGPNMTGALRVEAENTRDVLGSHSLYAIN